MYIYYYYYYYYSIMYVCMYVYIYIYIYIPIYTHISGTEEHGGAMGTLGVIQGHVGTYRGLYPHGCLRCA